MTAVAAELSAREEAILGLVVQAFIDSARPVGSFTVRRKGGLSVSTATIRNSMARLQDWGYVSRPHASAGCMPTDKGYRHYVDSLMPLGKLTRGEREEIVSGLHGFAIDISNLLDKASSVLGELSSQLGVVLAPHFYDGVLERIELLSLSSEAVLVVLQIQGGGVKTIVMEVRSEIPTRAMQEVSLLLQENLAGLTLGEIRSSIDVRFRDVEPDEGGIVRMLIDSANRIFTVGEVDSVHLSGTQTLMSQPEFQDPESVRQFIGWLEDREAVTRLLRRRAQRRGVVITRGGENRQREIDHFAVVSKNYKLGEVEGTLAAIGPTRMPYKKVTAVVDFVARMVGEVFEKRWE